MPLSQACTEDARTRVHEPGAAEIDGKKVSAADESSIRGLQDDGIDVRSEVASLRTTNRTLEDLPADLGLRAGQAEDAQRVAGSARLKAARGPHPLGLQPRGAAPSARTLAWDMIQGFWTSGILPPASAFGLWNRLDADEWAQVHARAHKLNCLAYTVFKSKAQRPPEQVAMMFNAYQIRFYAMESLRNAPEGYLTSVLAAIRALVVAGGADVAAANRRVTAAAADIQLSPSQLSSLSAAWVDFTDTVTSVSQDVVLLQRIVRHVAAEAQRVEESAGDGLDAPSKAMYSGSTRTVTEALARCNNRRTAAYMALMWATHEHLAWWQLMDLLTAADIAAPLDYIHVVTTLCYGGRAAPTATSAVAGDSS